MGQKISTLHYKAPEKHTTCASTYTYTFCNNVSHFVTHVLVIHHNTSLVAVRWQTSWSQRNFTRWEMRWHLTQGTQNICWENQTFQSLNWARRAGKDREPRGSNNAILHRRTNFKIDKGNGCHLKKCKICQEFCTSFHGSHYFIVTANAALLLVVLLYQKLLPKKSPHRKHVSY